MNSTGLLVVSSSHQMPLASGVFHSCITSPPYFGLRSYEGDQVIEWPAGQYTPMSGLIPIPFPGCWSDCEHEWITQKVYSTKTRNVRSRDAFTEPGKANIERLKKSRRTEHCWCSKCGGWRGALGAEPTIEMYIGHMVLICREIHRVLRPDGTFWLNIGDSYNGSGGAGGDYNPGGTREGQPRYPGRDLTELQTGDLMMIPARLALALQADRWILRNDNVWAKHPMPEPRKGWRFEKPPCTCITEKREAHIARQMAEQGVDRHRIYDKAGTKFSPDEECPKCRGSGRQGTEIFKPESWRHTRGHENIFQFVKKMKYYSDHTRVATETGANPKSILKAGRTNYSGKHFAVFPPHLIAPLIHASTPRRCCSKCAKPWAPIIESSGSGGARSIENRKHVLPKYGKQVGNTGKSWEDVGQYKIKSHLSGYRPTCEHDAEPNPGLVIDPFMGSGTTGMVAREFGVNFVGLDISYEYLDKQATIRSQTGQPSKILSGLPLFEGTE